MSGTIIPGGPRVPAELVTDAGVTIEQDATIVVSPARIVDFEGDGVTVTNVDGVAVVTIPGGGGTNPNDVGVDLEVPVIPGNAVYVVGSATANLAIASGDGSMVDVLGLATESGTDAGVIRTAGPLELTLAEWNTVTGSSSGLTPGDVYYLDPTTAGHITSIPPSTPGQFAAPIGLAMSTTILIIRIQSVLGPE